MAVFFIKLRSALTPESPTKALQPTSQVQL